MQSVFPLSISEQKQINASTLAQDKAAILQNITPVKQTQHNQITTAANIDRLLQESNRLQTRDIPTDVDYTLPESKVERFQRGTVEAVEGTLNLGYGLAAGAGAITESFVGPGGLATKFKESAVEKYQEGAAETAYYARPEDSFTFAFNEAKKGNLTAMLDWAAHGTGYVSAQLATILTGAGIISTGTQVLGKKTVKNLMGQMVKNEAERIVKGTAKKATSDAVMKQAIATVTKKVGGQAGLGAVSFSLEGGEILGTLAEQTMEDGTPLTPQEIIKGLTATGLAGAVEYLELVLGLKAFKGKLSGIPGTKAVEQLGGVSGRISRMAVTSAKIAPAEGLQEYVQTGIEQWGVGEDLWTPEARQARIDAAALGALSFVPMGGVAGLRGSVTEEKTKQTEKYQKARAASITKSKAQPEYQAKVKAGVKSGDVSKMTDMENEKYDPVMAADIAQKINIDPKLPIADKIKNQDQVFKMAADIETTKEQLGVRFLELQEKGKAEGVTEEEQKEIKNLNNQLVVLMDISEQIEPVINSMKAATKEDPALIKQVQDIVRANTKESVPEVVREMFGSKEITAEDVNLDDIITSGNLNESEITQLKSVHDYLLTKDKYLQRQQKQTDKTTTQVFLDVLEGKVKSGFKGINTYKRNIATALKAGNTKLAEQELFGLETFAQKHIQKTKVFRKAQDAVDDSSIKLSAEEQQIVGNYTFGPNFESTISTMEIESELLNKAVIAAEAFMGQPAKPTSEQPSSIVERIEESVTDSSFVKEKKKIERPVKVKEKIKKTKPSVEKKPTIVQLTDKELTDLSLSKLRTLYTKTKDKSYKNRILKIGKTKADTQTQKQKIQKDFVTPKKPIKDEIKKAEPTPEVLTQVKTEAVIAPLNATITEAEDSPFEIKKQKAGILNIDRQQGIIETFIAIKESKTLSTNKQAMLSSLISFRDKFNDKLQDRFIAKSAGFEDTSPINYFLVDSKLTEDMKTALAAVAYKWIATSGRKTIINDKRAIRNILGLPRSSSVNSDAYDKLGYVGNADQFIAEDMGRELLNILQIEPIKGSYYSLKNRTELSLGHVMLGILEDMDLIKRTHIRNGDETIGFQALKNNNENNLYNIVVPVNSGKKDSFYLNQKQAFDTQDVRRFFAVIENKRNSGIYDNYSSAKGFWEEIFKLPENKTEYTFVKPNFEKSPKQWQKGHSEEVATLQETNNIKHNIQMPYRLAHGLANLFNVLGTDAQDNIMGKVIEEDKHEDLLKGIISKNSTIQRSKDNFKYWLQNATFTKAGYSTEFFINEEFENIGRMHQVGTIKPQGDKAHRVLFNMSDWIQPIQTKSSIQRTRFKEAVAQAFGIETSKLFGIQGTLEALDEFITQPDIIDALEVLDKLLESGLIENTYSPENVQEILKTNILSDLEQAILVQAVELGGENLYSLKGLFEYQRFQRAYQTKAQFYTDIYVERDGIANGPASATIQLNSAPIDSEILGRLTSQGLIFNLRFNDKDHRAAYDPYESIGVYWGSKILEMRNNFAKSGTPADLADIKKLDAINNLLQAFTDEEGYLAHGMRKLAKGGAQGALYGAGETGILNTFIEDILVPGIQKHLMELNSLKDPAAKRRVFVYLTENLSQASGVAKEKIWKDLKDTKKTYLNRTLSPIALHGLARNANSFQGQALYESIEKIYGSLRKNSKVLNKGISLITAKYNALLQYKVDAWQKENSYTDDKGKKQVGRITDTALAEILDEMKPLLPRVKTPRGGYTGLYEFIQSPFQTRHPEEVVTTSFKQSKKAVYKKGKIVSFPADHLEKLKSFPRNIPFLKNPGVAPIIGLTQGFDADNANTLMGNKNRTKDKERIGMLNVHDAFIVGVNDSKTMSSMSNKRYFDAHNTYSIAGAIENGINEINKEYNKMAKSLPLSNYLNKQFKYMKLVFDEKQSIAKVEATTAVKISEVVVETNANRKIILNAVTAMNQYFDYRGGSKTGNTVAADINGITPESIRPIAEARKDKIAEANQQLLLQNGASLGQTISEQIDQENMGSKGKSKLTLDPNDYATEEQINQQNVLEVYKQIKDLSTISDNTKHDQYLQGVLKNLIQKVLQPVDLYLKEDPTTEPEGKFYPGKAGVDDQVFISSQPNSTTPISGVLNQGIRMSTGEVYVHELLHAVLHSGLKSNPDMRHKVSVLYKLVYKKLGADGYKAFLNDPNINVKDPAFKYEVEAAIERYKYIFAPDVKIKKSKNEYTGIISEHTISTHLDEFITLGLSNENFMKALQGIKIDSTQYAKSSWKGLKGVNVQDTLINIGQKIMNFIFNKFGTSTYSSTVAQELNNLAITLSQVDSYHKGLLYSLLQKADQAYLFTGKVANKYIKKAFVKGPLKSIYHVRNLILAQKEKDTPLGKMIREPLYWFQRLDYGIAKSVVTEVMGETERLAELHKLLNRRKLWLDAAKESEISSVTKYAQSLFKVDLTPEQKITLTKAGLNTDAAALLSHISLDRLSEILKKPTELQKEIDSIDKQILSNPELAPHLHYYKKASSAAGHHMIHTKSRSYEIPFLSAQVIAELKNTAEEGALGNQAKAEALTLVDQLISLYAISYVAEEYKTDFVGLIEKDKTGVEDFFGLHTMLKESAFEHAFDSNGYLFEKGYTKDILNQRIQFQFGIKEEEDAFKQAGYSRQPSAVTRDKSDPSKDVAPMYIYISRTGRVNNLQPSIASYTGNKAHGINSRHIAQELDLTTKQGQLNNQTIMKRKQSLIDNMMDPKAQPNPIDVPGTNMVPQVDRTGRIVNYRYMMSESNKEHYLEKVNEFDVILGAMAGQIIDKVRTPVVNQDLIQGLHILYQEEYQNEPDAYVEVGPSSLDPELRELYYLMPDATKKYIQKVWGGNTMYVAKDVLAIAFGYRQYSIVDAFSMDKKDRAFLENIIVEVANFIFRENGLFNVSGIVAVNNLENLAIELTKLAKNNIIVKSLTVTLNNLGSNFWYLRSRGVPTSTIMKLGWEAIKQGTKYQADKSRLDQLYLQQRSFEKRKTLTAAQRQQVKDNDNEILQLEDSITRNPTTETIEAGLIPNLVDDVETTIEGHSFQSPFEEKLEKYGNKLHPSIRNVGKILFLTQDTLSYKMLNNAVKMTDFIGRHILYNYYTDKARGDKQMTVDEAIPKVIEEFVNFNLPTHKMIEYFNSIGLFWFTKYGLRILKVIKNAAIDKPFEVALAFLMSSHAGMDNINNSIPGITQGIFTKLGDPVTSFIGAMDTPITLNLMDGKIDY